MRIKDLHRLNRGDQIMIAKDPKLWTVRLVYGKTPGGWTVELQQGKKVIEVNGKDLRRLTPVVVYYGLRTDLVLTTVARARKKSNCLDGLLEENYQYTFEKLAEIVRNVPRYRHLWDQDIRDDLAEGVKYGWIYVKPCKVKYT